MMRPEASKSSESAGWASFPAGAISLMRSPSRRISRGASVFVAGSRTRPFLIRSMSGFLGMWIGGFCIDFLLQSGMRTFGDASGEEIKDGHADSDAVGDLFEDGGLRAVGHLRRG